MMNRFLALLTLANLISACGIQIQNQDGNQKGQICTMTYEYGLYVEVKLPDGLSSPNGVQIRIEDGDYSQVVTWNSAWATDYPEFHEQYMNSDWSFRFDTETKILSFAGADNRAGTYSISVSHPTYGPVTESGIVVGDNGCHPILETVTLTLQ